MIGTVPFFVADRQMSLRILKGLPLPDYPGVRIGIMAHANTSANFQDALRKYPCDNLSFCDAVGGPCTSQSAIENCSVRHHILDHTVKMCDSGIFNRHGTTLTYDELFQIYVRMGVRHGIMIDVLGDMRATLESGRLAMKFYESYREKFNLMGVAQGADLNEYLECYRGLKELGFKTVAVGGMLNRRKNTVRYPYVRDEGFLSQILKRLHQEYPSDWLFALGCFHPIRIELLASVRASADYKGWIFKYSTRNDSIHDMTNSILKEHDLSTCNADKSKAASLKVALKRRSSEMERYRALSNQLVVKRRQLRQELEKLRSIVSEKAPHLNAPFQNMVTHALLDPTEHSLLVAVLDVVDESADHDRKAILEVATEARNLKTAMDNASVALVKLDARLTKSVDAVSAAMRNSPETGHGSETG